MTLERILAFVALVGVLILMKRSGDFASWIFFILAALASVFTFHGVFEYDRLLSIRSHGAYQVDSMIMIEEITKIGVGAITFLCSWIAIAVSRGQVEPFYGSEAE